jgi:phospholipase D1/2
MGSANLNDRSQRGDGDSEIALVVEDTDMIKTTMDGQPYMATRFAATLRRQLWRGPHRAPLQCRPLTHPSVEHLGLLPPQNCYRGEPVTAFMRPAPAPIAYQLGDEADLRVADPLADNTQSLWNETARVNREVFTELFHPAPTNLVRDWNGYAVCLLSVL